MTRSNKYGLLPCTFHETYIPVSFKDVGITLLDFKIIFKVWRTNTLEILDADIVSCYDEAVLYLNQFLP